MYKTFFLILFTKIQFYYLLILLDVILPTFYLLSLSNCVPKHMANIHIGTLYNKIISFNKV